jgi:hypothetical protein
VIRKSKSYNKMKNLFISLLLLFGFIYATAQESGTPALNYGVLQKKLQTSDLAIKHPKKSTLAKTWFLRGELFQDIYNVNIEFLRYGMSTMETKLFMKEPKEVQTVEEGGITKEIYVYPRMNLTFENDALMGWKETEVIHPDPLPEALVAYNKALELDTKGSLTTKIKEKLELLKKQF